MLESLFNKVAGLRPVIYEKRDSGTGVFLRIFETFKKTLFDRAPPVAASEAKTITEE